MCQVFHVHKKIFIGDVEKTSNEIHNKGCVKVEFKKNIFW